MPDEIEIKKVENGFIVKYEEERKSAGGPLGMTMGPSESFVSKTLEGALDIVKKKFGESESSDKATSSKPLAEGM